MFEHAQTGMWYDFFYGGHYYFQELVKSMWTISVHPSLQYSSQEKDSERSRSRVRYSYREM